MLKITRLLNVTTCFLMLVLISPLAAADQKIANAPEEICPILVGSQLPSISLQDLSGKRFDLNSAIADKPTVLIYFRGGW